MNQQDAQKILLVILGLGTLLLVFRQAAFVLVPFFLLAALLLSKKKGGLGTPEEDPADWWKKGKREDS